MNFIDKYSERQLSFVLSILTLITVSCQPVTTPSAASTPEPVSANQEKRPRRLPHR
jgi:hypothetical protein